jgi:YD repeat-containing protein
MTQFTIIAAALAILVCSHAGAAEQTRIYDSTGRSVGTAVPYSDGSMRYYDEHGRSPGTSSTSSDGAAQGATTTFYDAQGRRIGSTVAPSHKR